MQKRKRIGLTLLLAAGIILLSVANHRAAPERSRELFSAERPSLPYIGVPSCSARSCHGGDLPNQESRLLRNEYTTWIERDPHAGAYNALFNARSAEIMKNLSVAAPAYKDVRCLACHCDPRVGDTAELASHRVDGVGCEACHGGAAKWVDPHTAPSIWDKLTASQKESLGMTDVKESLVMASTCADCHVGAPADTRRGLPLRDVNHDLLAAGHPRLNFEYATFMTNLPPHWKQTDNGSDAERRSSTKSWAQGQIAASRAALTLLADRASRAETAGPHAAWPEFSEYDCSSCHHSLTATSARQRRPERSGLLGQPSWGNWFVSVPSQLLADAATGRPAFTALTKHLEQPFPALKTIPKLTEAALQTLSKIETRVGGSNDQKLADLCRERLLKTGRVEDQSSWELAEQLSLSTVALDRARLPRSIAADPNRALSPAEKLFDRLAFPKGTDGPGGFHWDESFDRDLKSIMRIEAQQK